MTQNPQDRSIEEYKSLRTEILQKLNQELRFVSFSFAATTVILSFAFTQESSLLFLVPLLVLTLVLFQLNDSAHSLVRITVYIRVFLESNDPDLNWETTIYELRDKLRRQPFPADAEPRIFRRIVRSPLFGTLSHEVAAIALGFISILLAALYVDSWYEYVLCGVVAVFWVIASAGTHTQLRDVESGDYEKYLESLWLPSNDNDNQASK